MFGEFTGPPQPMRLRFGEGEALADIVRSINLLTFGTFYSGAQYSHSDIGDKAKAAAPAPFAARLGGVVGLQLHYNVRVLFSVLKFVSPKPELLISPSRIHGRRRRNSGEKFCFSPWRIR